MRAAFIEKLIQLAGKDPRIQLLTADLGYMALEPFARAHPDKFLNVGVAEQNMVGIATGMAESGYIPFVYSIATFASMRAYEFIRNGPLMHRLPVRIVGIGGGFEYSHNGLTHFALEDIALMRAQPALHVVAPADRLQTGTVLEATWNMPGPVYYRLGKDDLTVIPALDGRYETGEIQVVREGADCLLLSLGAISSQADSAAQLLAGDGINCTHGIVASINPAPAAALAHLFERFRCCITVEAHYAHGGLFSMAAEVIAANGLPCRLHRCAVEQMPDGETGDLAYMHERHGLSSQLIAAKVRQVLNKLEVSCKAR